MAIHAMWTYWPTAKGGADEAGQLGAGEDHAAKVRAEGFDAQDFQFAALDFMAQALDAAGEGFWIHCGDAVFPGRRRHR